MNKNDLPERMLAALVTGYGGPEVIEIKEVPLPILKPNMVMVRVEVSAVNSADVRTRSLLAKEPLKTLMRLALGFRKPRQPILGTVFSGTVVATSSEVNSFKVGDAVFGSSPGMSYGCHAQYVAVPASSAMALMPQSMDFDEAAALPFGGNTALYFLEKHGAKKGESILINGAAGAVGSMAVQIAKNMGLNVTGVASDKNKALVLELGANHFIDYTSGKIFNPDVQYDIIMDTVGKLNKTQANKALKADGSFINVCGSDVSKENRQQVERLAKWFEEGKLKAVINNILPFKEIREAHRIVDTGHKRGSVLINMYEEEFK
ncbi:MAG: NAD(P)-dependent alcohol dehydrogenase [Christensenellaceae bacterium]|nr:NAD(P)-dependent alcohol dehydrogenase [Christensenellaceae bacterium]